MEASNPPKDGSGQSPAENQPGNAQQARTGQSSELPAFLTKPTPPLPVGPRSAPTAPAMGAVMRRQPQGSATQDPRGSAAGKAPPPPLANPGWAARPGTWAVTPLPHASVDNREQSRGRAGDARERPHSRSVDNSEYARRQGGQHRDGRGYSSADYDFDDDDDTPISVLSSVDNSEGFDLPPAGQYVEPARLTQLKGPQAYRPQGRSGPDKDVARLLHEAKKQQVVDRARAKGRDPNEGALEVVKGVTRSAKTQQQYVDRGNQLLARYRRERGILQDDLLSLDTVEFADWVLSLKPTLKATTWRPYKQSAKAVLATLPESDQAIEVLDADTVESGSEPERKPAKAGSRKKGDRELPRRTSSLKAKSISKPDFDRIVNYLRYLSPSKYGHTLADWLLAGMATGLRPAEWMAASLEISEDPEAPNGRYVWLYVLNAKNTNGRANGFVRTMDLSGFRNETVDAVRRMADRGREWLIKGTYEAMQGQCAQLMYNTAERMFPGRKLSYSLYTTRHQFMANAKSYHPPEAVSAMAGHGVSNTATENYGKKRSAWNMDDIEDRANPVAEEVATVKRRQTFFEERVKMREAAGMKPMGMGGGGDE